MKLKPETPEDILQEALESLREHFDNVQIFASSHVSTGTSENDTDAWTVGSGNWHARCGQIQDWMLREDENVRIHTRRKFDKGMIDTGEVDTEEE